jgi:hypothetical protein
MNYRQAKYDVRLIQEMKGKIDLVLPPVRREIEVPRTSWDPESTSRD